MKANKLILGTAQLGFKYGIANEEGKPSEDESFSIMKFAIEFGISYFDTAYSYGDSETIMGKFLKTYKKYKDKVNIITKMPSLQGRIVNEKLINRYFFKSLERLGKRSVYSYMIHDFNDIVNNSNIINEAFLSLKEKGFIEKIGVSVYNKSQIEYLLKNFKFDLIQLPINIFDQRLLKSSVLYDLKKKNIEIHARSIFLQGLIFMDKNSLPSSLVGAASYLEKLEKISLEVSATKIEIALSFVNSISEIDKIIIGVEKIEQLKEDVNAFNKARDFNKLKNITSFDSLVIEDENIIDPSRWRK